MVKGGMKECCEAARKRYKRYGGYLFLAYWFELWKFYEQSTGSISTRWNKQKFDDTF